MNPSELGKKTAADGIRLLELWYVDMVGQLKAVVVPTSSKNAVDTLEQEGLACDVGSLYPHWRDSFQDMLLKPDIDSYLPLPWTLPEHPITKEIDAVLTKAGKARKRPQQPRIATARVFCSLESKGGEKPFNSRDKLKEVLATCRADFGWQYMVGPELEFHYFDQQGAALDAKGYLEIESDGEMSNTLRYLTSMVCEAVGIGVECHHHEVGNGQQEIDFVKDEALNMADKVVTYKALVREIATLMGFSASFMPKPVNGSHGNGMHVHQSLWKEEQNEFYGQEAMKLSQTGRRFAVGLLTHAREITAITNQWVNSYKRIVPGFEAPVYIAWAPANRSTLIRIPRYVHGRPDSVRIEYRSPDPACNPYLTFAALLVAGLDGIRRQGVELPPPIKENIYDMPQVEIRQRSIGLLPTTLEEALHDLGESELMRNTFGDAFIEEYIASKRNEWKDFNAHVSDVEIADLRRYGL